MSILVAAGAAVGVSVPCCVVVEVLAAVLVAVALASELVLGGIICKPQRILRRHLTSDASLVIP